MSIESTKLNEIIPGNFSEVVEKYLQHHPEGFREYDLIEHLNKNNIFPTRNAKNSSSLQLFQKHFLVFHVLYKISEKMIQNKSGCLKISPLLIQKLSYSEAKTMLGEFDPLREYYMDLSNIRKATEETVDELLTSFWTQYLTNDKRQDALGTLGLTDPVDNQKIKSTYRRLVNTHHPDKGGDNEKIQTLNQAYADLIKT